MNSTDFNKVAPCVAHWFCKVIKIEYHHEGGSGALTVSSLGIANVVTNYSLLMLPYITFWEETKMLQILAQKFPFLLHFYANVGKLKKRKNPLI